MSKILIEESSLKNLFNYTSLWCALVQNKEKTEKEQKSNYIKMCAQMEKLEKEPKTWEELIDIEFAQFKKDLEEQNYIKDFEEITSRGCEYAATQEIVNDLANETLKELNSPNLFWQFDDIALIATWGDNDEYCGSLKDFVDLFWDKAMEKATNILKSYNYKVGTD